MTDTPNPELNEIPAVDEDMITVQLYCRFIKLLTGDDIICQVATGIDNDTLLLVRNPIKVVLMYDPQTNESMYAFYPWIPFTSQEIIPIQKSSVMAITTVRDAIREVYMKRVAEYEAALNPAPQSLETYIKENLTDLDPSVDAVQTEVKSKGKVKKKKDDAPTDGTKSKEWVN